MIGDAMRRADVRDAHAALNDLCDGLSYTLDDLSPDEEDANYLYSEAKSIAAEETDATMVAEAYDDAVQAVWRLCDAWRGVVSDLLTEHDLAHLESTIRRVLPDLTI